MVNSRILALRELMVENNIDVYYIPTADYHASEYVADYFKVRAYMSGFTGSAGTMIVTLEEAVLWADGRYFIQAEKELEGSEVELYKMGQAGVATVEEYLQKQASRRLGFDGRVVSAAVGSNFTKMFEEKGGHVISNVDLVDQIWNDRPTLSCEKAFYLEEKYTGRSTLDKVTWLQGKMSEASKDVMILSALDEIAWLFNIRGNDVKHTPIVYSYAIVDKDKATLYIDETKLNDELRSVFTSSKVECKSYDTFFDNVKLLKDCQVWCDFTTSNYATKSAMDNSVVCYNAKTPVVLEKAMKNVTELANAREAHLHDGAAVVEFMYWLKQSIGKIEITEVSAADYLESCRRKHGAFDISFNTICGYNANAAMMHYSATPENHAVLKPEGIVLVDSGGQYYQGTTDITRTMALGAVSEEWKKYNTTVLKGMINLSRAKFLHGTTGVNLDILARGPVWDLDINYQCGTGHGIGFCLGVHEGPQNVYWGNRTGAVLEEGMIITNEPGIYLQGELGIRIENELVVTKGENNFYGQFMHFEVITMAPIDVDLIDTKYLTQPEIDYLNQYHQEVYEKISPLVSEEVSMWLHSVTRPL